MNKDTYKIRVDCKRLCKHGHVDGIPVRINGDLASMDNKTLSSLRKMIRLAYNHYKK